VGTRCKHYWVRNLTRDERLWLSRQLLDVSERLRHLQYALEKLLTKPVKATVGTLYTWTYHKSNELWHDATYGDNNGQEM